MSLESNIKRLPKKMFQRKKQEEFSNRKKTFEDFKKERKISSTISNIYADNPQIINGETEGKSTSICCQLNNFSNISEYGLKDKSQTCLPKSVETKFLSAPSNNIGAIEIFDSSDSDSICYLDSIASTNSPCSSCSHISLESTSSYNSLDCETILVKNSHEDGQIRADIGEIHDVLLLPSRNSSNLHLNFQINQEINNTFSKNSSNVNFYQSNTSSSRLNSPILAPNNISPLNESLSMSKASTTTICPICQDCLKLPTCFPCGHLFCHECFTSLPDAQCPVCRQRFSKILAHRVFL